MSESAASATGREAQALQRLLRAIASQDHPTASRLLADMPSLARMSIAQGATRQDESSSYFEQISHYAYAGDTALHIAAAAYQRDIAAELVLKGANVSARNRRGAQPLHYAADGIPASSCWDPDAQHAIVEFLIAAGADPNSADASGVRPLHRAVRTRSTPAVRALLANGADPLCKNKRGSTPLHLAVQTSGRGGSGSASSRQEQIEIIGLLLSHGARLSDKNAAGRAVEECVRAEWLQALLR